MSAAELLPCEVYNLAKTTCALSIVEVNHRQIIIWSRWHSHRMLLRSTGTMFLMLSDRSAGLGSAAPPAKGSFIQREL